MAVVGGERAVQMVTVAARKTLEPHENCFWKKSCCCSGVLHGLRCAHNEYMLSGRD